MHWLGRKISLTSLIILTSGLIQAQTFWEPADSLVASRRTANVIFQSITTAGTLGGLQLAWYQDYQSGGFRFFNDWNGWMQMDKIGHSVTNYQIAADLYKINRWTGANHTSSLWWATGMAFGYQLTVEVMDGFSEGWGFSAYDLAFNTLGAGTFLAQQMGWREQRIKLKYSFWPSGLAEPDDRGLNAREVERAQNLFGTGLHEQWLKDYNGQTYWVSANLWSLIGKPDHFPKWLNVAVGYSVNGVLGAESNHWDIDLGQWGTIGYQSSVRRQRQVLVSLDIDLEHVDLPKHLVWLRPVVGLIKIPLPTYEWNSEKGIIPHALYW